MRAAVLSALFVISLVPSAMAAPADEVKRIVEGAAFKQAVATLDAQHDRMIEETITLTQIPAPPFKEAARAKAYAELMRAHGLQAVETDAEGNVMGLRRGTRPGPVVVVSAHLDTVFPEGTDVTVRREGTRLHAPGIADDTHSLAVMLAWMRALDAASIRTQSDILFVATVGEEGAGDLRGVRYFFDKGKYKDRTAAFFSFDGTDPSRVVHVGVGSNRYRVTFAGPGGHSYSAFGIVNPMAAMGRAIADFYSIQAPTDPKVTYAASVVGGGTSVNAIPDKVFLEVDMRSADPDALAAIDGRFKAIVQDAVAAENLARSTRVGLVTAEITPIGLRPAGSTARTDSLVVGAAAAISALGLTPTYEASSTDSNMPMSRAIPAVTMGSGGRGDRAHSLDEWIDLEKTASVRGMSVGLAAILAAAGVD